MLIIPFVINNISEAKDKMEKTYIKTNKNLSINEIKVFREWLNGFFEVDYNVTIKENEIIFSEE
jgi:hypothetical protein